MKFSILLLISLLLAFALCTNCLELGNIAGVAGEEQVEKEVSHLLRHIGGGSSSDGGGFKRWSGCKVPANVADFNWDQKNVEAAGYYFPLSSKSDKWIEEKMLGVAAAKCVRMKWSDSQVSINTFYGVNGLVINEAGFDCVQVQPPRNEWDCVPLKSSKNGGLGQIDLTHTAWITATDDLTYSFTVRCFHKAKLQGWVLFTTSKQLSPELKSKALEHAQQLGYSIRDGHDYITRPYGPPCQGLCST